MKAEGNAIAVGLLLVLLMGTATSTAQELAKADHYPSFSWETVPVGFHFGKDGPLMTAAEAEFVGIPVYDPAYGRVPPQKK